ncbi:hypothetical protein HYS54_03495 [Candidatus Micrarchaeota archaeon]|nr:hypothetical protein [Candidatus Micrarchaeota archaeon]
MPILAILLSSIAFGQVSGNITLDRTVIYPGEGATLTVDVFNHGFSELEASMLLKVPPDLGPSHNVTDWNLPARALASKSFHIQTASSAQPGDYAAFATISAGSDTIQLSKSVRISAWAAHFNVTLPTQGNGTARLIVTNIGSRSIQFVNATLTFPSGFEPRVLRFESLIIPPGHSEEKSFTLTVGESGAVAVSGSFTDSAGKHSFTRTIQLSNQQALPSFRINEAIVILLGIIIALLVGKTLLK